GFPVVHGGGLQLRQLFRTAAAGAQLDLGRRRAGPARRADRDFRDDAGPRLRRPRHRRALLRGGGLRAPGRGERRPRLAGGFRARGPRARGDGDPGPGPELDHRRRHALRAGARHPVPRPVRGAGGEQVRPAHRADCLRRQRAAEPARGLRRRGDGRTCFDLASADLRQRRPGPGRGPRRAGAGPVDPVHGAAGRFGRAVHSGGGCAAGAGAADHPGRGGTEGHLNAAVRSAPEHRVRLRVGGRRDPAGPRRAHPDQPLRDDDFLRHLPRVPDPGQPEEQRPAGARPHGRL
ncbi:MAG: Zinc ABC transporter, permease protein ZnuB, partial [uncultured Arthrobacter sp.]